MTETIDTKVEIDERIRQQPELLEAVEEATSYLEQQAVHVPPPDRIQWLLVDADGQTIHLMLAEKEGGIERVVQHNYPTKWIIDPVNRKICVLKMWSELLSKRSHRNILRITKLNSQLREEEANAEEDTQ